MTENEILIKWKQGLSKDLLAKIYRREYNQKIEIVRSSVRHRHDGKFITKYESLAHIEIVIYKYLRKEKTHNKDERIKKE